MNTNRHLVKLAVANRCQEILIEQRPKLTLANARAALELIQVHTSVLPNVERTVEEFAQYIMQTRQMQEAIPPFD